MIFQCHNVDFLFFLFIDPIILWYFNLTMLIFYFFLFIDPIILWYFNIFWILQFYDISMSQYWFPTFSFHRSYNFMIFQYFLDPTVLWYFNIFWILQFYISIWKNHSAVEYRLDEAIGRKIVYNSLNWRSCNRSSSTVPSTIDFSFV